MAQLESPIPHLLHSPLQDGAKGTMSSLPDFIFASLRADAYSFLLGVRIGCHGPCEQPKPAGNGCHPSLPRLPSFPLPSLLDRSLKAMTTFRDVFTIKKMTTFRVTQRSYYIVLLIINVSEF